MCCLHTKTVLNSYPVLSADSSDRGTTVRLFFRDRSRLLTIELFLGKNHCSSLEGMAGRFLALTIKAISTPQVEEVHGEEQNSLRDPGWSVFLLPEGS